ncbi:hypothetical protein AJR17_019865 [Shigella boydii]|uniref:Uncharacterized protein n=1 Tax=Shigella boydii TaxID=621 RepID=A0A1S9J3T3_SHIBO|nr:hypothetical protein AJR17_019865 [Shigella boydii]
MHWFPLLIWWTPLCLIRQILTRRFRLYAYNLWIVILLKSKTSQSRYLWEKIRKKGKLPSLW